MKYNKTFKRKIDQHYKFLLEPNYTDTDKIDQSSKIREYNMRGGETNSKSKQYKFPKLLYTPAKKLYKPCFSDEKNL